MGRDIFRRRPCMDTLLDGDQDVGRPKPVQRRCRTARDATTCPALVAERIGGDRHDLAGFHKLGGKVAPRPIPPLRQGHAVVVACVGYTWTLDARLELRLNWPGAAAAPDGEDRGDQRANGRPTLHSSQRTLAREREVRSNVQLAGQRFRRAPRRGAPLNSPAVPGRRLRSAGRDRAADAARGPRRQAARHPTLPDTSWCSDAHVAAPATRFRPASG
jgi:hypothetical protein